MRYLALLSAVLLVGCQSKILPGEQYVEADRRTFDAVDPYLELAEEQYPDEARGIQAVRHSWETRLSAAEARYEAMREQR